MAFNPFDLHEAPVARKLGPKNWPTVDETREVLAAAYADTFLQVIQREGIYYGLGAEQPHGYEAWLLPNRTRWFHPSDQERAAIQERAHLAEIHARWAHEVATLLEEEAEAERIYALKQRLARFDHA